MMELTRLVLLCLAIVGRVHSRLPRNDKGSPQLFSKSLKVNTSSPPCAQDFRTKQAWCSRRNLEHIPNDLLQDTVELYLQYNNIKALYNVSFTKYLLLKELYLFYNDIRLIETATFHPLRYLGILVLDGNKHIKIPSSELFRFNENLQLLGLSWCSLSHLPNDTMKWLPRLGNLVLWGNPISSLNITYCPKEHKLISVILVGIKMYYMTQETFRFTCKIEQLNLCNIPYKQVDPNVFLPMQVSHLIIGFDELYISKSVQRRCTLFYRVFRVQISD